MNAQMNIKTIEHFKNIVITKSDSSKDSFEVILNTDDTGYIFKEVNFGGLVPYLSDVSAWSNEKKDFCRTIQFNLPQMNIMDKEENNNKVKDQIAEGDYVMIDLEAIRKQMDFPENYNSHYVSFINDNLDTRFKIIKKYDKFCVLNSGVFLFKEEFLSKVVKKDAE